MKTRTLEEVNAELDELHAKAASARAAELAKEAEEANVLRSREQIEIDRAALIAAQQTSLARDLNVDVDSVPAVLSNKCDALTGDSKHILTPLVRLWNSLDGFKWSDCNPNPQAARDARHALAGMGSFPPVRRDDLAFSTEAALRSLPSPTFDVNNTVCDSRYQAVVAAFGLEIPRERAPGVESPQDARKRLGPQPITLGMAMMLSGDQDALRTAERVRAANDARSSELALIGERYQIACAARRAEHKQAVASQRTDIIAAIDRALAVLPIGEAWWWSRRLRSVVADERPHVRIASAAADFDVATEKIFHLARAAGARFDLNLSAPSTKKK